MNTPIDYSSRNSFGHFCCHVKQGKRLSEFLQKYTVSGTETNRLSGYNILVIKYLKISAGLPLLFIVAIPEKSSNHILHNLAMFTSKCSQQQTFQINETCEALKEYYLMSNIPKRNLVSGCHKKKKIDQASWRTTWRNYKHIPQIVCISCR